MRRGTTTTHRYFIDLPTDKIKRVRIIYEQSSKTILTKTEEDCEIEDGKITVKLSQEETFMFKDNATVRIQIRLLLDSGESLASNIIFETPDKCLSDEVLV